MSEATTVSPIFEATCDYETDRTLEIAATEAGFALTAASGVGDPIRVVLSHADGARLLNWLANWDECDGGE